MDEQKFLNTLLDYYHISSEKYHFLTRKINEEDLPDPFKFEKMSEAVALVKDAMSKKEKIMVYGDYDADGVMSTSIVVKMFSYLKYRANYYIPSRYLDGYGLNLTRAKEIVEKGYKLLITVDNGISANEAIEYCKNNGMRVLVIDHHERGEILPDADVIIHPEISNFSKIKSSAGFASYMFATALLGRVDHYLLTLGAISIVTDMMPLIDYNRDILRYAIEHYQYGKFKNIDLLSEGSSFDEVTIGMKIGPKINAVGRVITNTNVNRLVTYFTSDEEDVIFELNNWLTSVNNDRKVKSKSAIDNLEKFDEEEPAIIALVECEEGLIGLVANKISNDYNKPAIVFTKDSNNSDILKGSCRSPLGFNIVKALTELSELTLSYGGHPSAGGVTIEAKNFDFFSDKFKALAKKYPPYKASGETIEIGLLDINFINYEILQSFSPFGEEWKTPVFTLRNLKTDSLQFSRNGEHIMTSLSRIVKLVGFNMKKNDVTINPFIDVNGKMNFNSYNGQDYLQFVIEEILSEDDV